ncbi:hypothetical protein TTHERM_000898161 (macronuclear) [Tetrahymena thermophila SB210]|uniref:Uncharacterized protein n=1 Tax=Tetrahymena thermophila (strain SB210) TaxID=312017 RepID=W7X193_TETTS|nr:hypothetical protein TTHERM_000898161 [Tetrahymena thermophila SB210]EWS72995.1 hypothetical protein TTHERM_000898161 [Tetrahymena thermophila SB210]|eukprot:XP_012654463.1 hypothetical protein TTHERM_000898161 [Tetrahymena thermophila SB210]
MWQQVKNKLFKMILIQKKKLERKHLILIKITKIILQFKIIKTLLKVKIIKITKILLQIKIIIVIRAHILFLSLKEQTKAFHSIFLYKKIFNKLTRTLKNIIHQKKQILNTTILKQMKQITPIKFIQAIKKTINFHY